MKYALVDIQELWSATHTITVEVDDDATLQEVTGQVRSWREQMLAKRFKAQPGYTDVSVRSIEWRTER